MQLHLREDEMKALKRLCITGYCIVLLLAEVAFFAEGICEDALSEAFSHHTVTERLVTLYDKLNSLLTDEQMSELKSDAQNYSSDTNLQNTTKLYIAAIKSTVSNMSVSQAGTAGAVTIDNALDSSQVTENLTSFSDDMSQKMSTKVKENLSASLSASKRQTLETAITKVFEDMKPQIAETIKALADEDSNKVIEKLTPQQIQLIKVYTTLTSQTMRVVLVILAVVFLLAIVLLNRHKECSLMNIGGAHIVAGIIWLLLAFFAAGQSERVTNKVLGFVVDINVAQFYRYGGILLGSGIILCIFWLCVKQIVGKHNRHKYA
jgi:hypothetical protein